MKHLASAKFWAAYEKLPESIQKLADKNFGLLRQNPQHPSLHFKKVGRFWSAGIGEHYRAIATEAEGDMHWHWIGSHAEYNRKT